MNLLGDIYFESSDTENAEKKYLYFLKIVGDDDEKRDDINESLYHLAEIYATTKNYEKSEEYIKKLISKNPNSEKYAKAYKTLKQIIKEENSN